MSMSRSHAVASNAAANIDDKYLSVLDTVVDGSLAAVLLLAPWFMGGRHPLGELVYVICTVVAALAWLVRQSLSAKPAQWIWSGAEWLVAVGVVIVLVQLAPLPASLFN